jgi:molecular chaperone GrpE
MNRDYPSEYRIPIRVEKGHDTPTPQAGQPVDEPPAGDETTSVVNEADIDWQSLALRLRADMDNFRKRQLRLADEATASERERLLRLILPVADNLARVLDHRDRDSQALWQGVELTYRELGRLLEAEGVTRIESVGHPFTPDWHEAMATVPAHQESGTVVEEIQPGYRIGDRLLRPARVVVAV